MSAVRAHAPLAIAPVWRSVDADLAAELAALWAANGALADPTVAAARARQAVCIGRDEDGALAAVGTAILRMVPRLRLPMYYYRQYIAPAQRGRGEAIPLLNFARRVLEEHDASLPVSRSCGVLLELENPVLVSRSERVVVDEAGATFIGWSPRGLPLFAAYFAGAKLRGVPRVRPSAG